MAARSLRSLALAMSAVGTLVLTQGCVDDGVSLHAICPIVPDIDGDTCTYDPEGTTCVQEGVMNLASTQFYSLNLRMESGLTPRARQVPPQGEPNGLAMQSARVELRLPDGRVIAFIDDATKEPVANPFEVSATGYIPPGGSGSIPVNVITPKHAAYLTSRVAELPQVIAAIKVKGKTNGQQTLESGEYIWPIRLISQSPLRAQGTCVTKASCSIGQDLDAFACSN